MSQLTHSVQFILPYIRPGVVAAMLAPAEAPAKRAELRQFHGVHPVKRKGDPEVDALILEIRRLYEQCSQTASQIHAELTRRCIQKSIGWVRQTTQYHNRAHLTPTPGAACYLPESTP